MAVASDPFTIRLNYSPHKPEAPQHAFLMLDELGVLEALYGGAAGGGKSDALLMSALRYVDVPGYAALLLRRSYPDLALPGAIMDRGKSWLVGEPGVRWSERDYRFTFDTGATLTFGYLQYTNDRYRYASAEFQFIGFDELTQFLEADYRFLFSRLRRPVLPDDAPPAVVREHELLQHVPLRMRVASNPGGRGHPWVKRRFIDKDVDPEDPNDTPERARARIFIPARLVDNPHIDQESYRAALARMTRVERAYLEDGDWNADDGTLYFNGNDVDAAVDLGDELDHLAEAGEAPPPDGGLLALGIDWGDVTAFYYGWPLEGGGLWVVAGGELESREPGKATELILDGILVIPAWEGLGVVREPLELVSDVRYDAAGLQSQRTFNAVARLRRPDLPATKIAFGEAVTQGGKGYKRETAAYLKWLLERTGEGKRTGVLAISRRCKPLIERMRTLPKLERDPELWEKEADHSPDALVALAAPIAKANRKRLG